MTVPIDVPDRERLAGELTRSDDRVGIVTTKAFLELER